MLIHRRVRYCDSKAQRKTRTMRLKTHSHPSSLRYCVALKVQFRALPAPDFASAKWKTRGYWWPTCRLYNAYETRRESNHFIWFSDRVLLYDSNRQQIHSGFELTKELTTIDKINSLWLTYLIQIFVNIHNTLKEDVECRFSELQTSTTHITSILKEYNNSRKSSTSAKLSSSMNEIFNNINGIINHWILEDALD